MAPWGEFWWWLGLAPLVKEEEEGSITKGSWVCWDLFCHSSVFWGSVGSAP